MSKQVLGRGLGALLGGNPSATKSSIPTSSTPAAPLIRPAEALSSTPVYALAPDTSDRVITVSVERIHPSPLQPRKDFAEEALTDLAASIKEQGIIQPLVVREQKDGYELIAGERRWRAAQKAGLTTVPIIIRAADDAAVLEMMLIENLQRENLNAIEEAVGYADLIAKFDLTQEMAAAKVGKSRTLVANALRLLKLPPEVQVWIKEGQISTGHAKVILGLPSLEEQYLAAEKVIKDGMSVRQIEELVSLWQTQAVLANTTKKPVSPSTARDLHIVDLENRLRQRLGTKVTLRYRKGKGSVDIRFYSDDELERILDIAGLKMD